MAQYLKFYEYHGDNGNKFKRLIIDQGLIDNKIGFPICGVDDQDLLCAYVNLISFKHHLKKVDQLYRENNKFYLPISKEQFKLYGELKAKYNQLVLKYHINR